MRRDRADQAPDRQEFAPDAAVRRALARFAVLSLVAVAALTVATLLLADNIARSQALDEARSQSVGIASKLAAPLVDDGVRRGDPGASAALTTALTSRIRDGSIRHVKLWDSSGRIIWSDQHELTGRRFDLPNDVVELFGTTQATAELSDLSREENAEQREDGWALEVYVGAFDRDGEPLVFEAYLDTEPMEENADAIVAAFVPLIVGAPVLLLLVMLPLAVSLSRRVERAQADRATMMRHALLASELERRRIAEDLHHGVVQELAGLGYTLPTASRQLEPGGDPALARSTLEAATDLVHRNVQALRSMLTDIYPPDLQGPGLRDALQQLVRTEALRAGLVADIRIEEDLRIPLDAGRLAYRVVREAIRNVVKHAEATHVLVELGTHRGHVLVRVVDDGRGLGEDSGRSSEEGHLGLRLITDAVRDFGGRLELRSGATGGASLVARFPMELVA